MNAVVERKKRVASASNVDAAPNRFTKDILELIKVVNGIVVPIDNSLYINKDVLWDILEKAWQKPLRAAYDLPKDAKSLAASSMDSISIKDSRVILKGLYGYLKKGDEDHTKFDASDIEKVRSKLVANVGRTRSIADAIRNWR